MTRPWMLVANSLLTLILAISCSQNQGYHRTYYGLEDFGYQWDHPSPYHEWLPQRDEHPSTYHIGMEGPNGYIIIEFLPTGSVISLQDAISATLDLDPTEYEILTEQVLNSDLQVITDYRIKEYNEPDELTIRLAMFQFDSDYWAIVYGQPEAEKERRFNDAFETVLFSLKPYRFDPNNSSKE